MFDCDGVLLDTVGAKVKAFRAWVPEEHAGLRDEFNRYNRSAFGRSRRVQLRHFHEKLLGRAITEEFLDAEVSRFGRINAGLMARAEWLAGSREFIARVAAAGVPQFVLSGTPEGELRGLLEQRGVAGLFQEIIGSPTTKIDGLRRIIALLGLPPAAIRFVGDATHDWESARQAGVSFVYKPSDAEFLAEDSVSRVESLMEITL